MKDPKRPTLTRLREGSLHLAYQLHSSQRRNLFTNLERHMGRHDRAEVLARSMPNARIRPGLPSGPGPSPAVSHAIEFELFGQSTY